MVPQVVTPFFFGSRARRLYGSYHAPAAQNGSPCAVVLCPPWGPEAIATHRAFRLLATMLAAARFHCLRFDYYGTGDSGGDTIEGDVAGWQTDILTAMKEVRDISGADRVALVGLRHGALLAARVAVDRQAEITRLVLWDPVDARCDYLAALSETAQWLAAPAMLPVPRPAEIGGGCEVFGFPLSEALRRQMRSLDLRDTAPRLAIPTTLLVSGHARDLATAEDAFGPERRPSTHHIGGPPFWIEDKAATPPLDALRAIAASL